MTHTASEFDVRHATANPFLRGLTLFAISGLVMMALSPITPEERAEARISHHAEKGVTARQIVDVSDRLSRGKLAFDADEGAVPAERMLVLDLGRGIFGLCAEKGRQLRVEVLVEEDHLSRAAFDRPDLNDRLAPICAKVLA